MRRIAPATVLIAVLASPPPHARAATDPVLDVTAWLFELPSSQPCNTVTRRVTVKYSVEQVLADSRTSVRPGSEILVIHDCPRHPRGYSRQAQGDARWMRVGDLHHLRLRIVLGAVHAARPEAEAIDPFAPDLPRYRPLVTDRAPYPPRMIITTRGGGGTSHRLEFDQRSVTVGSRPDADVLLADASVAPLHLRLEVRGAVVLLRPSAAVDVTIDGKRVGKEPQAINYRSRIDVGVYSLSVALLTDPWFPSE